jgi:hypothetical protein
MAKYPVLNTPMTKYPRKSPSTNIQAQENFQASIFKTARSLLNRIDLTSTGNWGLEFEASLEF